MSEYYTLITKKGEEKIAQATALGKKIDLKSVALGDGGGSYYEPTADQTELRNEVYRNDVSGVTTDAKNPNWIVIYSSIPGDVGGFMIREGGIFDADGDMIAVTKYPEISKPDNKSGAIKDVMLQTIIAVSNTAHFTITIDPTVVYATKEDMLTLMTHIDDNRRRIQNNSDRIDALYESLSADFSLYIDFSTLSMVDLESGHWNQELQRVEC